MEIRARRMPNTKTIISPSPIPKPTQARDVTPITTTSPPGEDMPMATRVEEPMEQPPMTNEATAPIPAKEKLPIAAQAAATKRGSVTNWPLQLPLIFLHKPIVEANLEGDQRTAIEKVTQLRTIDYTQELCKKLFPQIYYHTKDLVTWTKRAVGEVLTLQKELDACKAKLKGQEELQRIEVLEREKAEWEEEKK
ncbi:unnamed protein product [Calypogeia fissa]